MSVIKELETSVESPEEIFFPSFDLFGKIWRPVIGTLRGRKMHQNLEAIGGRDVDAIGQKNWMNSRRKAII
ncbi:MAG: hypothetical protein GDA56_11740 [Hormoscilla sp. GM7CHS1pb]|nr:hypothetical protein [Hormoscilla sp. GM7CHS1pb]